MKGRWKIPLLGVIVLAFSLPAGFAFAQVVNQPEDEEVLITHEDPDPSTDAVALMDALKDAQASGDARAIEQASEAVREEWFSRQGPEEKEAAEAATPEPQVLPGTFAYVNEAVTPTLVSQCRSRLDEHRRDVLCELIVLYGDGKISAGAYTKGEVNAILDQFGGSR